MPRRFCPCGAIHDRDEACPKQLEGRRRRDLRRGRRQGRGYGRMHDQLRAQLLAAFTPGSPCAHCLEPMLDTRDLDLAHTDDRTGYRGLAHAACNRGNRKPEGERFF